MYLTLARENLSEHQYSNLEKLCYIYKCYTSLPVPDVAPFQAQGIPMCPNFISFYIRTSNINPRLVLFNIWWKTSLSLFVLKFQRNVRDVWRKCFFQHIFEVQLRHQPHTVRD